MTNEVDQHRHALDEGIHQMCRGTTHAAAHALHTIVTANDDHPRTMHTIAASTDRDFLPEPVAALLDRYDQRRIERTHAWRRQTAQNLAHEAAYHRIAATTQQAAARRRSRDQGYALQL